MQQQHSDNTLTEQEVWEAPELVKADLASTTLTGATVGVDGPGLLS